MEFGSKEHGTVADAPILMDRAKGVHATCGWRSCSAGPLPPSHDIQ